MTKIIKFNKQSLQKYYKCGTLTMFGLKLSQLFKI